MLCNTYSMSDPNKTKLILRQLLASSSPLIITTVRGFTQGYSTTLLPELEKDGVILTTNQQTWIASIIIIGALVGGCFGAYITDKIGRKSSSMIVYVLYSISWLLFLLPPDFPTLITARAISGFSMGLCSIISMVYISEIIVAKYMPTVLSIISTGASLGILIIHLINTFLDWRITAIIASVIPLFCVILNYNVPESPLWLMKKGKIEKAIIAYNWLNIRETNEVELEKIVASHEHGHTNSGEAKNGSVFKELLFYKLLFIMFILALSSQGSGYNIIEFYSVVLMKSAFGANEYLITIILDIVRVVFSLVGCYFTKVLARRVHVLSTNVVGGVSMVLFAICLHYTDILGNIIMLVLLFVFVGSITAGLCTVLGPVAIELLPFHMRSVGYAFCAIFQTGLSFLFLKLGPHLFETVGDVLTYLFCGFVCVVSTVILYFVMPETRQKKSDDCLIESQSNVA